MEIVMNTYIGVDLGTSSIKLLLVNKEGNILNQVSKEYPLLMPKPGWSEQEPLEWWNAFLKAIKELLNEFNPKDVKGISVAGQMHGLVILDKNNNVIRPAILWNDGRTGEETDYLNNVIGKEKLVKLTGNFAFAGFTAPKILWLKKNEPENFKKIRHILLPKDYLTFMLTGKYATDYSDASGMLLLDVEHKKWSEEMLDIVGVSKDKLAELHESYDPVGFIKQDLAEQLGLGEVIVAAGAGDNAGAAIGVGCVRNNGCNISLGTSGTIFLSTDNYYCDKDVALHSFDHANGKYHLMGCILSAASCNKWWIKGILNSEYNIEHQYTDEQLGTNKVLFAPYLMGERCPYNDVDARGCFLGVSMETKKEDMSLAVLEGVTFAIRDCLELIKKKGLQIDKVTLCGGGKRTYVWPKIVANVLNVQVDLIQNDEGPALGSAILAMVANHEYKDVIEAADRITIVDKSIKQDPAIVERYDKLYRKYTKVYKGLKTIE